MNGAPYGKWLPWNTAAHGGDVDHLINVVHWFMVLLFVGWGAFFVYCLVRFRARSGRAAKYELPAAKPSKYVEVAVAVFEAVVLIGFSMPVWAAYKLDPPPSGERMELRAVGEQFAWNFHYPGPDGEYGRSDPKLISPSNLLGVDFDNDPAAEDDLVSPEMHVQVNRPVHVTIASKDVIHSFAIPTMRVKQDALPGMHVSVWFTPTMTNTEFRQGMVDDFALDLENAWFAEKKLPSLLAMEDVEGIVSQGESLSREIAERLKAAGRETVRAAPEKPVQVVCAQLCGMNHYSMSAPLIVDTEEEFAAWVTAQMEALDIDLEEDFEL